MTDVSDGERLTGDEAVFVGRLRALLEVLPPALDRQVSSLGLTSFEFALLDTIGAERDGRLRLSRLATSTNATLPRLSRVVDALERKGLVARVAHARDGRVTEAVLTDAGRATLSEARPAMATALRRFVIEPLSPSEMRVASGALVAILGVLDPEGRLVVTHSEGAPHLEG